MGIFFRQTTPSKIHISKMGLKILRILIPFSYFAFQCFSLMEPSCAIIMLGWINSMNLEDA